MPEWGWAALSFALASLANIISVAIVAGRVTERLANVKEDLSELKADSKHQERVLADHTTQLGVISHDLGIRTARPS